MKSKSIIRQLTEAPIHTAYLDDDFFGDDSDIAKITLTKSKIIVKDLELGASVELSNPEDVSAAWDAYTQAMAGDGLEPGEVARRRIELVVPHSVAHRVVTLGQALEPNSVDADIGAILGAPAVSRVFSERILKDHVAAPSDDASKVFTVTKAMVRQLARDYHLAAYSDDEHARSSASVRSAAKAFGVDAIKIKVKHRDDNDEMYFVFANSGPEFDKLVRTVTRATANQF